jgi:hypothetical protein
MSCHILDQVPKVEFVPLVKQVPKTQVREVQKQARTGQDEHSTARSEAQRDMPSKSKIPRAREFVDMTYFPNRTM